jgi:hypothetical protein
MPDSANTDIKGGAMTRDDSSVAGRLTHHEATLKEHHERLKTMEEHLGMKKEAGVAKEETAKRGANRERKRH